MLNKELLCVSKNGLNVYYDPVGSHAATHFHDTLNLKLLVVGLIEVTTLSKDMEYIQHDFGHTIGKTDLLETTDQDTVVYAKRMNRDNYSRFIMNRGPVDSSILTIILYKHDSFYMLKSAYIGIKVPSFPTAPTASNESVPFWMKHALAWGTQAIQPGTETDKWPW